jgi:hypothetical protein
MYKRSLRDLQSDADVLKEVEKAEDKDEPKPFKFEDLKPFTTKSELPSGECIQRRLKEKTGGTAVGTEVKRGEARGYIREVISSRGVVYKLTSICSTGRGTSERLISILKPNIKEKGYPTARAKADQKTLKKLLTAGYKIM